MNKMTTVLKWLIALAMSFGLLWFSSGCEGKDTAEVTLSFLERGNAEGHLICTSDGGVEVGQTISFHVGARGTRIAFNGDIDFSEAPAEAPAWTKKEKVDGEDPPGE